MSDGADVFLDSAEGFLHSEQALSEFLESFERGTWPKPSWTHATHIAVAGCYLISYPGEEVAARVRQGIRHYNQCVGTINSDHSGYHETLTVFWLAVVRASLCEMAPGISRIEAVRLLVDEFAAQRDLFREYYSFDVVRSVEARKSWVAPDLKELP
jgi:hypothetical protein